MTTQELVIAAGKIESSILLIRGQRVMLDSELAALYGVTTKRLNEQINRNLGRFPDDFMFQLTKDEADILRSQFATSRSQHGGRRHRPYAFTEHGAIMAASVLNSEKAVKVSVYVVRAFVKLREMLSTHKELAGKLAELERKLQRHDTQILTLIEAIRQLLEPPPAPRRRRIGFVTDQE
jgi:hypothetical protein